MGVISTYQKFINNLNRLLTMLFLLFHKILNDYLQLREPELNLSKTNLKLVLKFAFIRLQIFAILSDTMFNLTFWRALYGYIKDSFKPAVLDTTWNH